MEAISWVGDGDNALAIGLQTLTNISDVSAKVQPIAASVAKVAHAVTAWSNVRLEEAMPDVRMFNKTCCALIQHGLKVITESSAQHILQTFEKSEQRAIEWNDAKSSDSLDSLIASVTELETCSFAIKASVSAIIPMMRPSQL